MDTEKIAKNYIKLLNLTDKELEELKKHLSIKNGVLVIDMKGLNIAIRKGLFKKAIVESGVKIKGVEAHYSTGWIMVFNDQMDLIKEYNKKEQEENTLKQAVKEAIRQTKEKESVLKEKTQKEKLLDEILKKADEIEKSKDNPIDDFSL